MARRTPSTWGRPSFVGLLFICLLAFSFLLVEWLSGDLSGRVFAWGSAILAGAMGLWFLGPPFAARRHPVDPLAGASREALASALAGLDDLPDAHGRFPDLTHPGRPSVDEVRRAIQDRLALLEEE